MNFILTKGGRTVALAEAADKTDATLYAGRNGFDVPVREATGHEHEDLAASLTESFTAMGYSPEMAVVMARGRDGGAPALQVIRITRQEAQLLAPAGRARQTSPRANLRETPSAPGAAIELREAKAPKVSAQKVKTPGAAPPEYSYACPLCTGAHQTSELGLQTAPCGADVDVEPAGAAAESQRALEKAFADMGLNESTAKLAAQGRA